ncbi:hypothetical protein ACFL4E_03510, partial [Candidatus Omnitrophota bacterium]
MDVVLLLGNGNQITAFNDFREPGNILSIKIAVVLHIQVRHDVYQEFHILQIHFPVNVPVKLAFTLPWIPWSVISCPEPFQQRLIVIILARRIPHYPVYFGGITPVDTAVPEVHVPVLFIIRRLVVICGKNIVDIPLAVGLEVRVPSVEIVSVQEVLYGMIIVP